MAVHQPRLPDDLHALESPVIDHETVWDGVVVGAGPVERETARAEHVELTGCHLRGAELTACEFDHLHAVDVVFDDCELSGSLLLDSRLTRVQFNRCRMSGMVASGIVAHHVGFTDCKLDGANFRMASLERCIWLRCELPGADFAGASLHDARLFDCNLSGADVSQVRLDDVALHGSDLSAVRGADALRGAVIGSEQVVPLALPVFAALQITVDDDRPD